MKYKTCTFFGHRIVLNKEEIKKRLEVVVEEVYLQGCKNFLIGTHGEFDALCLDVCRRFRSKYKDVEISVVLTSMSVFKRKVVDNVVVELSIAETFYSDVKTLVYPIEEEHFKQQIIVSNRYMVDDSDVVVAYIDDSVRFSGSKRALSYAKRKNKKVINLYKKTAQLEQFFCC